MNFADEFQDKFKKISKHAKNTFDYAKMELMVKNYHRECKKRYAKIGKLVYEGRKKDIAADSAELEKICGEIDKLKCKIKTIQKQIANIKSSYINASMAAENKINPKEKEKNVKIPCDNEEDIKFIKFCPKCNVGNTPDSFVCLNCGYNFKKIEKS